MGLSWQQEPLAPGAVDRLLVPDPLPGRLLFAELLRRISGLVSFEPDKIEVHLDETLPRLEPGQSVVPHGIDRSLTFDEVAPGRHL